MCVATRYATHQKVELKFWNSIQANGVPFSKGILMIDGHFYYITDQYFTDFPDSYLMQNKESVNGQIHDRPCFYSFQDKNTGLYWMIPISSQTDKFRKIHDKKFQKYHRCDTIVFGKVLGHEKAFLIQNMCPVTEKYVKNEYIDSLTNTPVKIDGALARDLLAKARKVLALQRNGSKLIFPDVIAIENQLKGK
jgi:hypothetical protein